MVNYLVLVSVAHKVCLLGSVWVLSTAVAVLVGHTMGLALLKCWVLMWKVGWTFTNSLSHWLSCLKFFAWFLEPLTFNFHWALSFPNSLPWPLTVPNLSCSQKSLHVFKTRTTWLILTHYHAWLSAQGTTFTISGIQVLCALRKHLLEDFTPVMLVSYPPLFSSLQLTSSIPAKQNSALVLLVSC